MTGLKDIVSNLEDTEEALDDVIDDVAREAEMLAKNYAPVMTGEMESAIYIQVEKDGYKLICDIPWAVYNEFGTMYMPVGAAKSPMAVKSTSGKNAFRPFMRPAVYHANALAGNIFGQKVARIWK